MGPVWFFIKVEDVDHSVALVHVRLVGRDSLGIKGGIFVDRGDIIVIPELLVDLSTMCLTYSHVPHRLIVQTRLLLQRIQEIGDGAVARNQDLQDLL